MTSKYLIALIKNGEVIPQSGLKFKDRNKAKEIAEYMTSLLPNNLREYEFYTVIQEVPPEEIEEEGICWY